jgi:hypothetical protein
MSVAALLDGRCAKTPDPGPTITALAERIAVGGWPGNLGKKPADAIVAVRGYIDEIRRVDLSRIDGVRRDLARIGRLLRSLARIESTAATVATIAAQAGTQTSLRRSFPRGGEPAGLARTAAVRHGMVRLLV